MNARFVCLLNIFNVCTKNYVQCMCICAVTIIINMFNMSDAVLLTKRERSGNVWRQQNEEMVMEGTSLPSRAMFAGIWLRATAVGCYA